MNLRSFALDVLLVAVFLTLTTIEARQVALPGPQCHPSVVNTMPPKIRQICKALETIWEFSDTMENYLDEKGSCLPPINNGITFNHYAR